MPPRGTTHRRRCPWDSLLTPPTVADFLHALGVTDPAAHGLLDHVTNQYRAAHLTRHNIDPGDRVHDKMLLHTVMDAATVTVCARCDNPHEEDREPEEIDCRTCGDPGWTILPTKPLPIALGGPVQRTCCDCGRAFTFDGYRVERQFSIVHIGTVCPACARAVPETRAWQGVCDLAAGIDEVMQQATDARQREQIAAKLAHIAGHFAGWRWPEDHQAVAL